MADKNEENKAIRGAKEVKGEKRAREREGGTMRTGYTAARREFVGIGDGARRSTTRDQKQN